MTEKNIFTLQEVAKYLKVSAQTITKLIKRGELKARKVGRVYRLTQEDVDRYLEGEDKDGKNK